MLDNRITDGLGRKVRAEVTSKHALRVAIENYHTYAAAAVIFVNDTYGVDMNRNFGSSVAEVVHDGTDSAAWTGNQTVGTSINFADTNNPDTDAKNISCAGVGSINGDLAFFERGSDLTLTTQTALQGRIYITQIVDGKSEIKFAAWDTGLDVAVGAEKKVYDYVDQNLFDTWQTFNIPISDFGLASGSVFDAFRMKLDKNNQIFDLDNIQLTEAGESIGTTVYEIKPGKATRWIIDGFTFTMADAYAGTVTDGTMPNIPYDGFLGVSELSSPMLYQVYDNSEVTFSVPFAKLIDFFQFGSPELRVAASDGTNTWIAVNIALASPIVLNGNEDDKITLTHSADLSGLLYFRFTANARQQDIPEALA